MTGRPRKFDEDQALLAAMDVFWDKGFEATSCNDLFKAMGIKSGSMYSTFGDKRALFEKAFELYQKKSSQLTEKTLNADLSPLENLHQLIRNWGKSGNCPKGCLVGHVLIEFADPNDPIVEKAKQLSLEFQNRLANQIQAARDSGQLKNPIDTGDLAAMLVNTAHGLTVLARSGASPDAFSAVIRATIATCS